MLTATRDDGTEIVLTRQERALLLRFVDNPGALLTRKQLLQSLGDVHGAVDERAVDYLINRLRKRLGDRSRKPRFIATQYGEGYYWIPDPEIRETLSAFLLIGPVFGLQENAERVSRIIHSLGSTIGDAVGSARKVLVRPDWRHDAETNGRFTYTLDVSTHLDEDVLHLALVLRDGGTRQPISDFRRVFARGREGAGTGELAEALVDAIWHHEAIAEGAAVEPSERPPHLRMHDAAMTLTADTISWRENAARLHKAHNADAHNPRLSVMLALNHYARLIQSLGQPMPEEEWTAIEDQIEKLALRALPDVEDDPHLLLGIAKVLRFIDRGYLDLADRLTEKSFRESTAFAAVFSMKAQIAASRGEIDAALRLYDKAIELANPGSQFHIYLLILKGVVLMAGGRRRDVEHIAVEINNIEPAARTSFGLFFLSPNAQKLQPDMEQTLASIPPQMGEHFTDYLYNVSARQFRKRSHRRNVMNGFTTHLQRHHGEAVIPPEVRARLPELVS